MVGQPVRRRTRRPRRPRLVAAPPGRTLAHLEGGTHSAHRALVSPAFRGHALTALTAGVERTAYVLARRLADRQEADLVAEFCHWLPTAAAVAALGLPYEDTARVHAWCRTGLDHLGGHHPELDAFLLPYIARRRAHPGDDLLSALCTARADGRPLSDEAVAGIAGTLLGAGGEATAHALASFLANLLDHPGQLALVRARPELTAGAWAESLRRDPRCTSCCAGPSSRSARYPWAPPWRVCWAPRAATRPGSPTRTATTSSGPTPGSSRTVPDGTSARARCSPGSPRNTACAPCSPPSRSCAGPRASAPSRRA